VRDDPVYEDRNNRKGIPSWKTVSLLCKLIQFWMIALSVTVHKALILLDFFNHPYRSLVFARLFSYMKHPDKLLRKQNFSVSTIVQIYIACRLYIRMAEPVFHIFQTPSAVK
jgi:hypothetical protein